MIPYLIPIHAISTLLITPIPYFTSSTQINLILDHLQKRLPELDLSYGDEISISMTEEELFLSQSIIENFDENLSPPKMQITAIDNEQIAFSWPSIENANFYNTTIEFQNCYFMIYIFKSLY